MLADEGKGVMLGDEHDVVAEAESGVFDGGGTESSKQLRLS
jgi:hypothetical protein